MGWYAGTITRLGHQRWFAWVGRHVGTRLDRVLYRASGGRVTATGPQVVPTMLLTTIGRTSGLDRTVPVLYIRDGPGLVVAGTNFGQKTDPNWARNLAANSRARVQVGRTRFDVVARQPTGDELRRLWARLDREWPAYRTYRDRSGRDITVFVLEPVQP